MTDGWQQPVLSSEHFYAGLRSGRTGQRPEHWPADVEIISLEGLSFLGLDSKGNLYLDGHRVHTERRLATQERWIAWIVAISTIVAAIAAVVGAYAAICQAASMKPF